MAKPIYTVEKEPTAYGKWRIILFKDGEQVRSATCPEEGQAERMKKLWKKQFVDKKKKEEKCPTKKK